MCVREGEIIYIPLPLVLIFGGMSPPLILISMDLKEKLSISAKEMEKLSSLSGELNSLVEHNYQGLMESLTLLDQGNPDGEIITSYPGREVIKLEDVELHILQYKFEEEEGEEGVVRDVWVSVPYGADLITKQAIVQRAISCVKNILSWNAENK